MTPEQKELKVEAFRALLDNPNVDLLSASSTHPNDWRPGLLIHGDGWVNDHLLIRLAQRPTSIPWHNPEGVTQEQLEPEKGWRFLTVDEVGARLEGEGWCQVLTSRQQWGSDNGCWGANKHYTYRTREPLPEKYQHLVPESEEARAMRLLESVEVEEGWGPFDFEGKGVVRNAERGECLIRFPMGGEDWNEERIWPGDSHGYYYARARKLPTEKEKAEEVGKPVSRHDNRDASAGPGYYAEIIKEPEMVPFTQETFPLGAWVRREDYDPILLVTEIARDSVCIGGFEHQSYSDLLRDNWLISTDSGTTWTRAGKGVEK